MIIKLEYLRAARAYLGLKQEEVAERSGVTVQTISMYESENLMGRQNSAQVA